jgi:glycosyltransferase involved in cell wall biosynthesis
MRIVLVYLGRRGAGGKISYEMAHNLSAQNTLLLVLSEQTEMLPVWQEVPIQHIVVETYKNIFQAIKTLVVPLKINEIVHHIKAFRPDVLLFPMFHPWNMIIQRKMREIPSVVFVHDPRPHPDFLGYGFEKLENLSIHQAARCVVMSDILRPNLVKRGVPHERIDVIPLGPLNYSSLSKMVKKQEFPTVLFFGRIAPYKGLDTLLKAFDKVIETIPCRLRIVGDGNIDRYKNWFTQNSYIEIINRWVPEEEVGDIFASSDIVVLPYTSASQSGIIPIAAVYGLPVIATRTGGLPEQIEDGLSGWLVPPRDITALAQAISQALTRPDLARERGLELKKRYEKWFNWERISNQIQVCLERAMQAHGPL